MSSLKSKCGGEKSFILNYNMTSSISILRTVAQVRQWRLDAILKRQSVGFVPTMGALHAGHCSLISQAVKENDKSIVSIFVNPSQFAPHEDLDAYPRTIDSDIKILEGLGDKKVDAVFIPKVSEMYPSGITTHVDKQRGAFVEVLGCSEQLEGSIRPQFFRGVATVVTKLLNVVSPTSVYFGQKDAQQCVVIKNLVKDLLIDTKVNVLPTTRESNGLAMSSRNAYLSEETRQKSAVIYQSLCNGKQFYESQQGPVPAAQVLDKIRETLNEEDTGFEVEYLAASHPETLSDLKIIVPGEGAVISTAVRVPKKDSSELARLIDNVVLE